MKRTFILVAIALLAAGAVFAEEAVLIDFSKLAADIVPNQDNVPTQNRATMMDYSNVAGGSFTTEQKGVMKTSLALPNWDVVLASSSRNVLNQTKSYTLEAPSKQFGKVFGVRVHFPVESFNSWAKIQPPFEIPAFEPMQQFDDQGNAVDPTEEDKANKFTRFEEGKGVTKNVGVLKAVQVNVYGLNFPHGLSAILIDSTGKENVVFMGYLNFDGWGQLTWENPNYVSEVRNRELRIYPLYPKATPFVRFGGFIIQKDASKEGGDFITYFKDVKVIFDKALLDTDRDIEDENLWNIVQERETNRKNSEMERFGNIQVMRYLENQKKASETKFTPAGEKAATN
ncbi:MAG: flagellar protein [Treponema sp. GWB1_62_6]|nr:MAG: flagellar protein [Treponema sp. GWA1_62_8]OHE64957.1 MAG: flagellar protein [Treponema sp. GWB1_62_6]OHE67020.1 MAG: flagellar protein [Treponema sp. GWC1_61_84]OHE70931.1 MAG: flagellar protein [Treponema sp. RIFOXYC1_FULL_61_9]HCM27354.1 flagellar protein [Treponema sp.]